MMELLEKSIQKCAKKLENFRIDSLSIGYSQAEQRIKNWVGNFSDLIDDPSVLQTVLEHIHFFSDSEVFEKCHRFFTERLKSEDRQYYFCCLGTEKESSARIMRSMNRDENHCVNIVDALQIIQRDQPEHPGIVFYDDFLNSGGQFQNIMETLAGKTESLAEQPSRPGQHRQRLTDRQFETLQRCELIFVFLNGTPEGRCRGKNALQALKLRGRIETLNSRETSHCLFGNENDLAQIRRNLDTPVGADSFFRGRSCTEIKPFLEICEKAGLALLRNHKQDWSAEQYAHRSLGYGNRAQLFVSQYNVPTCTLTCLWLGGRITIDGRELDWQPLLPRVEKSMGGSEYREKSPKVTVGPVPMPSNSIREELSRLPLDQQGDGSPALSMTLFHRLPVNLAPRVSGQNWQDTTSEYTKLLDPDIAAELLQPIIPGGGPPLVIRQLDKHTYMGLNSALRYRLKDRCFRMKIHSLMMAEFPGSMSFLGLRLQFNAPDMTLADALDLNHYLPINKAEPAKNIGLYRTTSQQALAITVLLEQLLAGALKQPESIHPRAANGLERFPAMTFVREGSDRFEAWPPALAETFRLLGTFQRGTDNNLQNRIAAPGFELHLQARAALSDKGAVMFCGGGFNQNRNFLAEHFHRQYGFLYLLFRHRRELAMLRAKTVDGTQPGAWLERLQRLPLDHCCQKPDLNRFAQLLDQSPTR